MKKALALLMALVFALSFAACSDSDNGEATTAPDTETTGSSEIVTAETTAAPTTEPATDANGETLAPVETTTAPVEVTTLPAAGLNSTDPAQVIAYYAAAVANTKNVKPQQTMTLDTLEGGSGFVGAAINAFEGIAKDALAKNSIVLDAIPGHPETITVDDVTAARAVSDGKTTTVTMAIKEQIDPPKADGAAGPVGHTIGTLGDIDTALNELKGVTVNYSQGTLSLKYHSATMKVVIDNATGTVKSGTWHFKVHVTIDQVQAKILLFTLTLKGAYGIVDYKITL